MRVLLLLVLIALLVPGTALAQECVAPPGTAAVDEYCETVPTATGDQGANEAPPAGVSAKTLDALRDAGPDGAAFAKQLETPGNGSKGSKRSDGVAGGGSVDRAVAEPGSNPLTAIRSAVSSGASVDPWFGWVLLLLTVAVVGAWWLSNSRRRA